MARKKEYIEEEVIEKAMNLFWRNGYESTSMQMLEKEMGINKFSIYSSFGNKHGVFVESLKSYKQKVSKIFQKLRDSNNGVEDIKEFFYNSVDVTKKPNNQKGCLVTNTYNEFAESEDKMIKEQMETFMKNLKQIFIEKLRMDPNKNEETILKQANYLLLSKHGLAAAARVNTQKEIEDYIEIIFKNL
ncbi:TetR/AcrR family transcriptional regulator [Lutibacter sp. TH_r2]|uniref:TetR/AcrR family transcriptional regulator n=1 Tax=Lutibacter sp. TH_r2 TaxID=3082083 RepID=UPI002953D895|nr:TetR/AcrR family transcriptional regulator [Lutibacter sp. TH_r2]MDV7186542.1 TetR/AcrR family transcriptional regulator [Lutibacter sp. TH_r2]